MNEAELPGASAGRQLPPIATRDLEEVLDQTCEIWRGFSGERLFVTGGTGFFGTWLLESFLWANRRLALRAEAVVLSRNPEAFRRRAPHLALQPGLTFLRGDTKRFKFPDGEFAALVHAATASYGSGGTRLALYDADVAGTRHTLDFALKARVARYLFISSGAVYGRQPSDLTHVHESYAGAPEPCDPGSAYGQAKRASEFLCALYCAEHGVPVKIARCFAFVGPHLPLESNYAIGNFLRDAMRGGPVRITGDGTALRTYMYASDLMVWLWTILFKGAQMSPYNVGSDVAISIRALAGEVAAVVRPGCAILSAQVAPPEAPAARYVPSITRARSELGLTVRVGLREAIARTFEWRKTRL